MCMYSYLYYNEGKRSGCEYGAAPLSLPARLPRRPALGDVRSDEGGGGVRLGIVTKEHRCQLHKLRRLELLRPQAQHLLGRRLFGGGQQRLEGDAEHLSPLLEGELEQPEQLRALRRRQGQRRAGRRPDWPQPQHRCAALWLGPEGVGRDLEEPLRLSEELRHHREDAVVLATRRREQLVGDLGLHGEDDLVDLLERAEQLEEELARQVEGGVGQHREGPSPLRRESRQVEPEQVGVSQLERGQVGAEDLHHPLINLHGEHLWVRLQQ
mmetsp:Transcript_21638/g.69747  ORF Transcript_21638/g.69747 Transcript_21638/m.69747 type:complete len:268 (-) Transcript_21638:265-1068(-)